MPTHGSTEGFGWEATTSFTIPDHWKSGVYIASFATAMGVREARFVVRPRTPQAPLPLTIAMNTYAAYNNVGGKCFYDYISTDRRHVKTVSFDAPSRP